MKYTIEYDCGCTATGPTPLPNYCPEHGEPSAAPSPTLPNTAAGAPQAFPVSQTAPSASPLPLSSPYRQQCPLCEKREPHLHPEMQPFYEKCWDSWQSCSDVWPKLLPWWVRRFAGEWADSRVQAATNHIFSRMENAEARCRDMERQRDKLRDLISPCDEAVEALSAYAEIEGHDHEYDKAVRLLKQIRAFTERETKNGEVVGS